MILAAWDEILNGSLSFKMAIFGPIVAFFILSIALGIREMMRP